MSPDFRQSANNANNKKGGANPPPSFQSGDEAKNLIEKNLKEGYDAYYSKYEDPLSRAVSGIVRGGDFSPEAIKRKANQVKLEEINKLRSKYPGKFKDEDFSLDNMKKLSSDEPDTITQRTFRDLKNETAKKGDMISAEAINELAKLEYLEKHFERLEKRAMKAGEVAGKKETEKEITKNIADAIGKNKKMPLTRALPVLAPKPVLPPTPHIPHAPSRASAPSHISAPPHISIPSPASSPQTSSPLRGSARSSSGQGGKISTKLTPSTPASSSSPQSSPASSAPASAAAPASASKTSPARAASSVPVSSQTTAPEPASTPASAPASQITTEPASKSTTAQPQTSPSRGSEKQPINNQGEEAPAEQMSQSSPAPISQAFPAPSQAMPESAQPRTKPEPTSTRMPTPPSVAAPSAPPQSAPAKTPLSSQGLEKPPMDNVPEKNAEGISKKDLFKEIEDKVREKLEDSLEKNIDNGMGGSGINKISPLGESKEEEMNRIMRWARNKAGQGSKKGRFDSLNDRMNKMNEDMNRRIQNIKNESLVPAREKQKEIEEKIKKQRNEIANKFNARKMAMLEKARKLKKMAGIKAKKSHISPGMVKILTVVTLVLAVLVDLIDIIGEAGVETVVFTIIAYLINFVSSIIITATWMIIFSGHKGRNKKATKVTIRSLAFLFGLENIPLVELAPFNAIAVILNYLDYNAGNKPDKR